MDFIKQFTVYELRGMLGKNYQCINMMLWLVAPFIDLAHRFVRDTLKTFAITNYSEVVLN